MASASLSASAAPPVSASSEDVLRLETRAIDASTRSPVLAFLVFGVLWLLVATAFALVSVSQLHQPEVFGGRAAWLNYGRAWPAAMNALLYGWGFNAAFAVALWLMARLSRAALGAGSLAVVGGLFWNVGVAIGVGGVLAGDSTGHKALEMPWYAAPVLFAAYALVGASAVATFRFRRSGPAYVSQWYLLAALFWFPWLYSIAQVMLEFGLARGTVQSVLNAWYAYNVHALWLAPIGLAAIYYFLPKLLGRTIHDYRLARMGFWSYGLFASWAGAKSLIGGPVPAWVQACGTAASLMLLIPVVVIAVNHYGTLAGRLKRFRESSVLAFIGFSAAGFSLAGVGTAVTSLRTVAEYTQFTFVDLALEHIALYAFFSMAAFGAVYYLVPRLVGRAWPSAALIAAHFRLSAIGAALAIVCLIAGGVLQGLATNDVARFSEFEDVAARTMPFLAGHTLGWVILAVGHVAFAVNLGMMILKPSPASAAAAALQQQPPALEVVR